MSNVEASYLIPYSSLSTFGVSIGALKLLVPVPIPVPVPPTARTSITRTVAPNALILGALTLLTLGATEIAQRVGVIL